MFLNLCCPSFGCARRHSVYLCLHLGQKFRLFFSENVLKGDSGGVSSRNPAWPLEEVGGMSGGKCLGLQVAGAVVSEGAGAAGIGLQVHC